MHTNVRLLPRQRKLCSLELEVIIIKSNRMHDMLFMNKTATNQRLLCHCLQIKQVTMDRSM